MLKSDTSRNKHMLKGPLSEKGYDWWWHSFTAYNRETGEAKPFFIEFFVINPALGGGSPIYGQLPENKQNGVKPSYVMVKVGAWGKNATQLHGFYGIDELEISNKSLNVKVGDCALTETSTHGEILVTDAEEHPEYMCDNGHMKWDLIISKKIPYNVGYGASPFFRDLNSFEMFWHAEGMKTEYAGMIELDGETYDVIPSHSFGYADKNWGSNFTSPWVWISSCNMTSRVSGKKLDNSVFDVGGGCPVVFGKSLDRKLLICICYEGKEYEFSFARFLHGVHTDFDCYETECDIVWHIETHTPKAKAIIDCECPKGEMLLINYEAPNGLKRHNRLWNGGTGTGRIRLFDKVDGISVLVDDIDFKNAGCEYGEYNL